MNTGMFEGHTIRLEPLCERHIEGLAAASAANPSLYTWSLVPQGVVQTKRYVQTAIRWRDAGTAVPFAIVRRADDAIVGSTRFFDLARWAWPPPTPRAGRKEPDTGEIGYTWLGADAIGTAANVEAKMLLLTHAFESWAMQRVSFCTDERNERSARAIERLGARFEGTLRSHRLGADGTPRNSRCYAIVAADWPLVRKHLEDRLTKSGIAWPRGVPSAL